MTRIHWLHFWWFFSIMDYANMLSNVLNKVMDCIGLDIIYAMCLIQIIDQYSMCKKYTVHWWMSWMFCIQVQHNSFLKSHFFSQWRELCVLEEFFLYKLRVCGYIWTSSKVLSELHARHSEAQLTMHGPQFRAILGSKFSWLYVIHLYLSSLGYLSAISLGLSKALFTDAQLLVNEQKSLWVRFSSKNHYRKSPGCMYGLMCVYIYTMR
jgi:hypothetical protein